MEKTNDTMLKQFRTAAYLSVAISLPTAPLVLGGVMVYETAWGKDAVKIQQEISNMRSKGTALEKYDLTPLETMFGCRIF